MAVNKERARQAETLKLIMQIELERSRKRDRELHTPTPDSAPNFALFSAYFLVIFIGCFLQQSFNSV